MSVRWRRVLRPAEGDAGPLDPDPDPRFGRMRYPGAAPDGLPADWPPARRYPRLAGEGLLPLLPALVALAAPGGVALAVAGLGLAAGLLLALHAGRLRAAVLRAASVGVHGPVWDRLLALSPPAFARLGTRALAARLRRGLGAALASAESAAERPAALLQLLGGLGIMALLAPATALTGAALLALGGLLLARLAARAAVAAARAETRLAAARARAAATVPALPELRALGAAGWSARRLRAAERAGARAGARAASLALGRDAARAAVVAAPALAALLLGRGLPPEAALPLLLAALPAGWGGAALLAAPDGPRRRGVAALRRALGRAMPADQAGGLPIARFEGLRAESLTFAWPGADRPAVAGVSFALAPGEAVALAAPSGRGKTTLVRIVLGLIAPDEGRVIVNGRDVADWDPVALRRVFGAAMQDQELPFTTIRRAVTGSLPLGEDRAREALARAGLLAEVEALPMGLMTLLQHGAFPTGMLHGLLIARALAPRPGLLVLDETLGAVGPERAAALLRRLRGEGVAVLFCAHDPALLALADRVVRLGEG